jgi:hypothetical protein
MPPRPLIRTKGNIIVNDIKVGDIHYEFEYGCCAKVKVISLPEFSNDGCADWKSENLLTGRVINYRVCAKHSHYGPNLYDYEAYQGCLQV